MNFALWQEWGLNDSLLVYSKITGLDLPCGHVFEEAEWKSACAVVKRKKDAGEPSLSEFIGIIGIIGGHLGRKSDGAPRPQSLWQGLARVRDFACAWHACHGE